MNGTALSENTVPVTCLDAAKRALICEAESIQRAAQRLDAAFLRCVGIILECPGKILVTGVGKSGLVGQKVAATLTSTGRIACFVHPTEALHGDLGIYSPGDVTIHISNSGSTAELIRLVPLLRQFNSPQIGILGCRDSPLARMMDAVLDASVEREADPCNLAPTASTAVAMALGDALASALMQAKNFTPGNFAKLHPGGRLGWDLRTTVRDVMHSMESVATVGLNEPLRGVVIAMTRRPLGGAIVLGNGSVLVGLITDGDVRRALERFEDIRGTQAQDIMTTQPITIQPSATVREALAVMENRTSQIAVLPVTNGRGEALGLVRLHDLCGLMSAH